MSRKTKKQYKKSLKEKQTASLKVDHYGGIFVSVFQAHHSLLFKLFCSGNRKMHNFHLSEIKITKNDF